MESESFRRKIVCGNTHNVTVTLSIRESRAEGSSKICACLEGYAGDGVGNESSGSCKMGNRRRRYL